MSVSGTLQRDARASVEALSGWHLRSCQFRVSAKMHLLGYHDSFIQHLLMQSLPVQGKVPGPGDMVGGRSMSQGLNLAPREPFPGGSQGVSRNYKGVGDEDEGRCWVWVPRQMVWINEGRQHGGE